MLYFSKIKIIFIVIFTIILTYLTSSNFFKFDDNFVAKKIKKPSEQEAARFWPEFTDRFEYDGWHGQVLAKLKTKSEFRSAVTFEKKVLFTLFQEKSATFLMLKEK